MKKLSWKSFSAGIIIGALIIGALPVMAETVVTNAVIYLGRTKLTINGEPSKSETLVYNDNMYIKIGEAAEQLGFTYIWDKETNTTNIDTGGVAVSPPQVAETAPVTPAPIVNHNESLSLRTAWDVEQYIKDNYKQFSYTYTSNDGLDTKTITRTVKIVGASVAWTSANTIASIDVVCDYNLLLTRSYNGYDSARGYMKKIADDLVSKLPGVEFSRVNFYYGWYTYPNIQADWNFASYCTWKTVDGKFQWDTARDSAY